MTPESSQILILLKRKQIFADYMMHIASRVFFFVFWSQICRFAKLTIIPNLYLRNYIWNFSMFQQSCLSHTLALQNGLVIVESAIESTWGKPKWSNAMWSLMDCCWMLDDSHSDYSTHCIFLWIGYESRYPCNKWSYFSVVQFLISKGTFGLSSTFFFSFFF
jgi:hypothetical protein